MSEMQPGRISEADMLLAQNTANYLDEQEKREREVSTFPLRTNRYQDITPQTGWPRERAWYKAGQLSKDPESGISTRAHNAVANMLNEAYMLNDTYDVVATDGEQIHPVYSEQEIAKRQEGNNSAGMQQILGAMARSSIRQYDIKDGMAMRSTIHSMAVDGRQNVHGNARVEPYVPFAPQHQERAKELMMTLADKQMRTVNEANRRQKVRLAKEILGRAGVKIPKAKIAA